MLKKRTGLALAIALGGAVSLSAQSATTAAPKSSTTAPDANELNIVGCVSRSADGGFVLTNAHVEPATRAAATTTSGSGTTTTAGTSGSAATRPTEPAGSGTSGMTTWALKGGSDLEKHVGHRVQVTGRAEAHQSNSPASATSSTTSPSSGTAGATGSGATGGSDEAHTRALDVQSIKVLATSCP